MYNFVLGHIHSHLGTQAVCGIQLDNPDTVPLKITCEYAISMLISAPK